MTFSVKMPALGESVTEGTVTRWLKAEGDHINVDEPLLEVSTDKVDTEIPSPVSGTLSKILVQIDATVPVGADLAIIEDGAAAPAPVAVTPVAAAPVAAPTPPPVAAPVAVAPVAPVAPAAPAAAPSASGTIITMPALGESVTEGTVTRWLKNVGDSVAVDEALLEVSTDKVDTEIPSPVAGTIISIDVAVDSTVPVGARLAVIGGAGAGAAPASPTTAMTAPTGTVSPSFARTSVRIPDTGDGTSVSTLSVDTSKSGSSAATASPTFLNHFVMVPSVTVSPSCGSFTSAMSLCPYIIEVF